MADTKITEKYEYKTNIITNYDGSEQRIKTRQYPRHLLSYDYDAMNSYQAQWLRGMNRIRQSDTYYMPMWHNVAYLTEDFIEHGKALYIDKDYMYNFDNCNWIEIFVKDDELQSGVNIVRQVDQYTDNIIALKKKIDIPLNKLNTWVYPLKKVNFQPNNGIKYVYSDGTNVTMNYEDLLLQSPTQIPYKYRVDYDILDNFNIYNIPDKQDNKEVFLFEPQWADDDSDTLEISKNTQRLDNETGYFVYDLKNNSTYDTHKFTLILNGQKMLNNLKKFFFRMSGMYKSFYIPTWAYDIKPCFDIKTGTNFIYTKFNLLYKMYAQNTRKKKIIIFTRDFKSYIYSILAYNIETINNIKYGKIFLEQTITDYIPVDNVRLISYFNIVRFNDDALEIDYEANTKATTTLSFKEVDDT